MMSLQSNKMRRFILLLAVPALALAQTGLSTTDLLKKVESRYNSTKRLQAQFTQTYTAQGRTRPAQRGTLQLSKPGRMRWEYSDPAGDFFLSDGKFTYQY